MAYRYTAHFSDTFRSEGIHTSGVVARHPSKAYAMDLCHAHVDLLERQALDDATRFEARGNAGGPYAAANLDFAASRRADAAALGRLRGKLASAIPAAGKPGVLLDCAEGGFRVFVKRVQA